LPKLSNEQPASELSESPTATRGTQAGVILGTASYMSPEQARGKKVDKRTDIWAFGCCLYEALTGRKAFGGETATDIFAKILEREPDWQSLPTTTHAAIRSLVRRCLQKDPNRRIHDIADARIEIEESLTGPSGTAGTAMVLTRTRLFPFAVTALLALLLGGTIVWSLVRPAAPTPRPIKRFSITPSLLSPNSNLKGVFALSPDGANIALEESYETHFPA